MSHPTDTKFKIQINFTKAYQDETGAYIEGIASGPEVDLTDERMSPQALKSMVDCISRGLIELRDEHKDGWNDDLGEIVDLRLTEDNHLFYKAKLDLELSGARDLWYRMTHKNKRYGVSIGGSIIKAGYEYVADLGRDIFTYFEIALHEISVVRQAAYQYSFANAVTKSLPTNEEPMKKSIKQELVEEALAEQAEGAETTEIESTETTDVAADDQSDANESTEDTQVEEAETDEEAEDAAVDDTDAETESSEDEVETESEDVVVDETAEATEEAEVSKAIDQTEDFEAVRKSLSDAQAQIEILTKSLSDKDAELETVKAEAVEKAGELETTQTELEDVSKKYDDLVALEEGRKAQALEDIDVEKSAKSEDVGAGTAWLQDQLSFK